MKFSLIERRALLLLNDGWAIRNAQGPVQANSELFRVGGVGRDERVPLGRGVMARLRDLGLIAYVNGHAALATITAAGRRAAKSFEEEIHAGS